MSYTSKTISETIIDYVNRNTFLPAIQREYVWNTYSIEKLFDSIMCGYPISSFLFWKIREERKKDWVAYQFVTDFDKTDPHNEEANLSGVNQDIYLVLDGQQRLTSLLIGLKGSYSFFYYRWRKTRLYLNLFKKPTNDDNPEELTYQFQFRENDFINANDSTPQYWYLVSNILDFNTASAARKDIREKLSNISVDSSFKENAVELIEELHSRLFTEKFINIYEEKSQEYDKVVEIFIRTNTGGVKLEYSDILLSTATAKWKNLNARKEIYSFTDEINSIGNGYSFGKDFVLKGCLYLTDHLPIQYKVGNFTQSNLELIEENWTNIQTSISDSVKLINKFGFNDKNLVAKLVLLPIALYLKKVNKSNYVNSTNAEDIKNQLRIQKWVAIALLKNMFGSSTDNTLKSIQDIILNQTNSENFPCSEINQKLNVISSFSKDEIDNILRYSYGTKYSYLILSLFYPNRDWKDCRFSEDHIFPKSEFTEAKLRKRGYNSDKIKLYQTYYNTILNLQLLDETENKEKSAKPFNEWIKTRDDNFKKRHSIPIIASYDFDSFIEFINGRKKLLSNFLENLTI
ncbi:DUF262 domain-containing protein [Phocaeicola vulgatus]|jgi:hypothetical protein|uniref:DUF262 domain-containing protein n=1 Tax=Phocaeicola vulgatus TaxID=821 RepID=UPI000E4E1B1D|nr:DUF262 domain-containing protein [Phocaeicola vulgatus]RGQ18076.1 DUF262 domain-containing protein [Phocaeicola vulgatus]